MNSPHLPATVSCRRLCLQHAPLQLARHNLPLLLQLPSQPLELELLQEDSDVLNVSLRVKEPFDAS